MLHILRNGWRDPHHWKDLVGGVEATAFSYPVGASPMFQNFMGAIIEPVFGRSPPSQAQAPHLSLSDR